MVNSYMLMTCPRLFLATVLIVNVTAFDVCPPRKGLNTVTWAVPAVATSLAEIDAVNWVLLTKVVGRVTPFHWTTEPLQKFVPVNVRVKPAPPPLFGETEVSPALTGAI